MDFLEGIRRWQWAVLAVIVGLSFGASRSAWITRAGAFGETLNNQFQFERGLIGNIQSDAKFHVASVFMFEMPGENGTSRTLHAVRGTLEDWNPNGSGRIQRPTTFIAPVPYRPHNLAALNSSGSPTTTAAVGEFDALPQPTVVDYLNLLEKTKGVAFNNAWWDSHPYWTGLSVSMLLIGVVFPSVINLALYGMLFRPRVEKGGSLWSVDNPKSATAPAPGVADVDALNAKIAEIEADIVLSQPDEHRPPVEPPQAVRTLVQGAPDPVTVASVEAPKDFGAGQDDYYPTEQKARKQPAQPARKR